MLFVDVGIADAAAVGEDEAGGPADAARIIGGTAGAAALQSPGGIDDNDPGSIPWRLLVQQVPDHPRSEGPGLSAPQSILSPENRA